MSTNPNDDRSRDARDQLERLRLKLLDLSGRNRFLNFRHGGTLKTQLRIVDASLSQVRALIESGSQFSVKGLKKPISLASEETADQLDLDDQNASHSFPFLKPRKATRFSPESLDEAARNQGVNPTFDLPTGSSNDSKIRDLQSLLFLDDLERRLQALHDEERRFIQELGINTLYCCFGFLEWFEADHSEKPRFAPLLLYPMQVERVLVGTRYHFNFSGLGEEPESNISLIERLARDFRIRLPEFDSENEDAEAYLEMVRQAVRDQEKWRIRPFVTFSILNFAKLAMYRDLDPSLRPPDASLENHEIIREVLAGVEREVESTISEDLADHPDTIAKVPLIVTEADSSQFAAIAEALSGSSLVIEGPPGTGKSQTITNIIAAAMSKGLRVLFVAEKLAALEVVKSKLDSYGLGPYCLELHSTKARKSDIHRSIAARIFLEKRGSADLDSVVGQIAQQQRVLADYLSALHSTLGKLGRPIHDLLWREQRLRLEMGDDASAIEHFSIPGALDFDPGGISQANQTLQGYETTRSGLEASYGDVSRHPWHGIDATNASFEERQAFISWFKEKFSIVEDFGVTVDQLRKAIGIKGGLTLKECFDLAELSAALFNLAPKVPSHIIKSLRSLPAVFVLERFVQNIRAMDAAENRFGAELLKKVDAVSLDLEPVANNLVNAGFGELRLDSTSAAQKGVLDRIHALESLASYIADLGALTGSVSKPSLMALQECARAFNSTPREAVLGRTSSLTAEENNADLRTMFAQGTVLKQRRVDLQSRFDLDGLPPSRELRSMTRALRDPGLMWWFNGDVRAARRLYRSHSILKFTNTNETIAVQLTSVADLMDEIEAFEASPTFKRIAASLFDGINSNFELIEAIRVFADNIRSLTPAGSAWAPKLRSLFLENAIGDIDGAVALCRDERFQEVLIEEPSPESVQLRRDAEENMLINLRKVDEIVKELPVPPSATVSFVCELLRESRNYRDLGLKCEGDGAAKSILRELFVSSRARLNDIDEALVYAQKINEAPFSEGIKDCFASFEQNTCAIEVPALLSVWKADGQNVKDAFAEMAANGILNAKKFFSCNELLLVDVDALRHKGNRAQSAAESLEDWIRYTRIRERALLTAGSDLINYFDSRNPKPRTPLSKMFEYLVVRSVVRTAVDRFPALRDFPGVSLSSARSSYQRLDHELIGLYRRKLAAMLYGTPVDPGNSIGKIGTWTGKALLTHEIGKQIRHVPIRELVRRSGVALQQLKPCFMMSPLSVAQYIGPGTIEFDLVVIDEASQMKPEDSLGALSRGKRVVVVGDPKQLPPTSFFERTVEEDDVPDEDVIESESILDLAIAQYGKRRLRWHYRSRHESLIAFSNRYFYESNLVVFPSPDKAGSEFGVRSNFVEGGLYKSSLNSEEARRVAEAAIRFMHDSPKLSVGIVAMNQQQRDLISEYLDKMIAEDPIAADYVDSWNGTLYPYFVKNLESVQGDERDVIFISTVYGPEAPGSTVKQLFGPIIGPTGWRRLNVLFTRARNRIELFTSMKPSDVRVDDATRSRGVVALRDYLDYAQSGRLETGVRSRRPPDSDFEIAVAQMLEARGFEVEAQVGVSHYYIDLAVRHPRNGSYLFGIECDGATYHSAKSARDRDRTREEALNELGWKLYRIWSTDWFADPRREFLKLEVALREAISEAP